MPLSTIFPGLARIFRQMPGVAPGAQIGSKILRRIRGCDLVRGCRQSFAFGRVLSLPADRTFRLAIHHKEPFLTVIYSSHFTTFRFGATPPAQANQENTRWRFRTGSPVQT